MLSGSKQRHCPRIEVLSELEGFQGWRFDVVIRGPGGARESGGHESGPSETRHTVALAWVDYEHWSHGALSPSRVAEVVLETLLEIRPETRVPERFDLSIARRMAPALDERLRAGL
jgi:hypothetical protein